MQDRRVGHRRQWDALPLHYKLSLLITALVGLVLVFTIGAAYVEVRRSAEEAARTRITSLAGQLGALLQVSARRIGPTARTAAASPEVRALLGGRQVDSHAVAAALQRARDLGSPRADSVFPIGVWAPRGAPLVVVGSLDASDHVMASDVVRRVAATRADTVMVGEFYADSGHVYYWTAVPVRVDSEPQGVIAQRQIVESQPAAERQLRMLLGDGVNLHFTNRDPADGLMTSMAGVPSVGVKDAPDSGVFRFQAIAGSTMVAARRPVGATPWAVQVEIPLAVIRERAWSFVRNMSLAALVLVLLGAWLARVVSRRVTSPLVQLTEASVAVAQGDYDQRVRVAAQDEIGRLAEAFNLMAAGIAAALAEAKRVNHELAQQTTAAELARREAQAANHAKSDFLAIMSHELRTPLNAVLGYASLLEDRIAGEVNPLQAQYLTRIKGGGSHLLSLIDEVLTMARVDAGREEVVLEHADAFALAREAVGLVDPLVAIKGLVFEIEIPSERCDTWTDPTKVRQILLNLLSNAVKFTERGRVTFRASMDGDDVRFEVSDTGIGIAQDLLGRVFEPFYQVDQSKTRNGNGTGLGLTVAHRLTTLLGGSMEVESAEQRGSTFRVCIPVASEEPARTTVAAAS
jgi:signal transduction histidine kinase